MNNADIVLQFLKDHDENMYCDDCLTINSQVTPHQQINQICRIRLKDRIVRKEGQCSICGRFKLVNSAKEDRHART